MKYFTSMLPKIFCQYNFISDSLRKLWIANNVCWPKKVLCTRQRKNIDKFRSIPISTIDPQHSYCSKIEIKSVNSSLAKVNLNWVLVFRLCCLNSPVDMNLLGDCWSTTTPPCLCPPASGKCSRERERERRGWICSSTCLICSSQYANKCVDKCKDTE